MATDLFSFVDDYEALCLEKGNDKMIIYDSGVDTICFSYLEVYKYARRFIKFFQENGLKGGDAVVAIMPNSLEMIICFFAAMLYGLKYAPLPCTISKREYNNWINLVHPKLVIKKEEIAEYDSEIKVWNCACNGDLAWLPQEECSTHSDMAKVYLMTSGTTGTPKAMSINIDKLWSSGKSFVNYYGIENSMYCFWNYLPMSYLGGLYNLALIPLCCKGSFVISEPFSGKTILNYWNFVKKYNVSALWLVPSIVQGLLKLSKIIGSKYKYNYSDIIKIAFLGTAPIQTRAKEEFEEVFGIRLYENFALSESTFLTAENEDNILFREQGSVGRVLPYVSLKFIPVDGIRNINTIWIKTPYLFDGYLNMDGIVELETDQEGYFNTKDLGYINEDNILVLAGRNRDIVKKGGLFVSLVEIENVVKQLPFIEDAAAVPIKHDFYGESYILCVILSNKNDADKQREDLRLWMLENFVSYKMPEKICIYDEFPKTASGKIQKNRLTKEIDGEK